MKVLWRIQLLDGLRATRGNQVVERFRTKKAGVLLAYMAYHDRAHPREVLMELLWPEDDPTPARTRFRLALASLRRQLEPPGVLAGTVIRASRDLIQLNAAAYTTDVAEFEGSLRAAGSARSSLERVQHFAESVQRYGGELLPGYFEDWILPERQRLAEQFHGALLHLLRYREQSGDLEGAIDWARRAVAADPLREEAQHELIRLLATAGQSEAARRQYREMERLFERELGSAPPLSFQALAHGLGREQVRSVMPSGEPRPAPPRPVHPVLRSPPISRPAFAPSPLPTGTVTLLLIELAGPVQGASIDECYSLLRPLLRGHGGSEVTAPGETLQTVFGRVSDALAAAVAGQRALAAAADRVAGSGTEAVRRTEASNSISAGGGDAVMQVQMALHTGEVAPGEEVPHSATFQHAVRLLIAAHPGQILLSEKSAALLADLQSGLRLLDLGSYRLGDAMPAERLFQVQAADRETQRFPPPNAAPAHAGNLPLQLTRFFGRETELPELIALLLDEGTRLVTLTGPGGTGKTRLALEAARRLAEPFANAVYFVALADLTGAGLIPGALRDALLLPTAPSEGALEQVIQALSGQPVFLALDNFEHLLEDGAALVWTLLERLPLLTCVITSRQPLGLPGEREFSVLPLRTPRDDDRPDQLLQCESVQLFVNRAQAARPDFQVTPRTAPAVAELCRRLEGIPLALELAAARARMLTIPQMLAALEERFDFLVSRRKDLPRRHQSVRAALDWSYQLLSPELQRFFSRLSVFRGGWTPEAAAAVCLPGLEPIDNPAGSAEAALACLEELTGCSLILVEEGPEVMRSRLLETVREYAWEQLTGEERREAERRHAEYFVKLAERAEPELRGPEQKTWLDRLVAEEDNLRAAMRWAEQSGEAELGLRLGAALLWFWHARGHHSEVRQIMSELLRQGNDGRRRSSSTSGHRGVDPGIAGTAPHPAGPPAPARSRSGQGAPDTGFEAARAKAKHAAGQLAALQNDHAIAIDLVEEGLLTYQELGDVRGAATSLALLSEFNIVLGRLETARSLAAESLSLWQRLGDRRGVESALGVMARLADAQGDYALAQSLYADVLAFYREIGDRQGAGWALNNLGQITQRVGDLPAARAFHEESLAIWEALDDRVGTEWSLMNLGHIARAEGDLDTASSLYGQWERIARKVVPWQVADPVAFSQARLALDRRESGRARLLLEQSLTSFRRMGGQSMIAHCHLNLGHTDRIEGKYGSARVQYATALGLFREMNDRWAMALSLEAFAGLAVAEHEPQRAARLLGAADGLREALGTPRPPIERVDYEQKVTALLAALGDGAFATAHAEGRALPLEQAVDEALEHRTQRVYGK